MWQIILGALLLIGGIGNIGNNIGAFFTGIILGGLLIFFGLKKKGFLPKKPRSIPTKRRTTPSAPKNKGRSNPSSTRSSSIKRPPSHYIVFDIETTGLSRANDRIIEIAATEYVDGNPVNSFHRYVNPERHISSGITRLTGICDSDVAQAPTIAAIKHDIIKFLGTATLVGHNIKSFDIPFLETQLNHHFTNPTIDTLQLSKEAFPGLPNYKLSTLDHVLGLGGLSHHRAANDIAINNSLLMACFSPQKYMHRVKNTDIINSIPVENRNISGKPDIHDFHPSNPNAAAFGPLAGKCIVFSGELSMLPEEAYQIAVDAGAILKTTVSKKVDYLIQGYVDPKYLDENGWSNKQRTAHKLIESGEGHIRIINEAEFLRIASPKTIK